MERMTYRLNDQFDNPTDSIILMPYLRYEDPETRKKILNRLAAYEDTGLEPEEILYLGDLREMKREIIFGVTSDRLKELAEADKEARLVVLDEKTALCMCAGARAIENNKRLFGASYCYDVFGKRGGPKEISYYEASNHLRDVAEPVLDREEAEAALAQKGGTNEDSGGL